MIPLHTHLLDQTWLSMGNIPQPPAINQATDYKAVALPLG
jgi:hypothetical protein